MSVQCLATGYNIIIENQCDYPFRFPSFIPFFATITKHFGILSHLRIKFKCHGDSACLLFRKSLTAPETQKQSRATEREREREREEKKLFGGCLICMQQAIEKWCTHVGNNDSQLTNSFRFFSVSFSKNKRT